MSKSVLAGSATKRSLFATPRLVFAVFFAISAFNYLDRYVLLGAANVVAKELGFSLDGIGIVTSAFVIVLTFCTIPMGLLADRMMRKNVVAGCVAVWSVATALSALSINLLTLFLSRMVLGVGEAGYFPAGTALLSDYFNRASRSRVMSFWGAAQYVGVLGGFALGGALAGLYIGSWRLAFLITGIPGLLLAVLVWKIHEPRRNQADEEVLALNVAAVSPLVEEIEVPLVVNNPLAGSSAHGAWQRCLTLLRIKTLAALIVMQVFAFFVLGVSSTFLPTYLKQSDTFGLQSSSAGLYSGVVVVIGGLLGTMLGGFLADLLSRRFAGGRVLICGISFLCAVPVFMLSLLTHNFIVFTVLFLLSVLLLAVYNGPSTAATQDIVPSWLRASAVAVSIMLAHLFGDAFSPALVGILATSLDPTHGQHFQAGRAGLELSMALVWTCTPALALAGIAGVLGSRWMKADVDSAVSVEHTELVQG
ncbi:MAG: MFS transporter [Ktedonobacteraceae bacterium]